MKKIMFIPLSFITWWLIAVWFFSKFSNSDDMGYGALLYTSAFGYSPVISFVITFLSIKNFRKIKAIQLYWSITLSYFLISIYGINRIVNI